MCLLVVEVSFIVTRKPWLAEVNATLTSISERLTREPEMQDWIHQSKSSTKLTYPVSPEMSACMDRFFFNHYCACFRHGAFARANSSM